MYSALSTLNTTTEVPLSKAPNPQLLPGRRSINGCPLLRVCVHGVCVCVFTAVCVHFGWDKCRAQIPSMGHHTWPYVTSLSLSLITNHCMENWIRHNILIVNQFIDKNGQLYTYPNFIKIDIKKK